ncbi:alpha-1,2-fucosyltransferase [Prochlorococcus sp. AH-716-P05]|nr:alpha-1,2-fucosyltransferase [Prochlorococcus sp. AH-716-P05]
MKKIFKCQLIGGLGNQIFQNVILDWIQKKSNKEIIISKFDYAFINNKIRNLRGVQSLYYSEWLNSNHLTNNNPMFVKNIIYRLNKFLPGEKKFITDDLFFLGLKNGKDFLLKKLLEGRFMRAHCIFPQVINFSEFEDSWLKILHKLEDEDSKNEYDLKMNDYDITIHLRRGDYLNFPNLYYELKKEYFYNSLDILKEKLKIYGKPKCLIIGNDIKWAKDNLNDSIKASYQYKSEFYDFKTLVFSNNIILSNSSFSIAAGKLAFSRKTVQNIICPKKYYVGEHDIGPISHNDWSLSDN